MAPPDETLVAAEIGVGHTGGDEPLPLLRLVAVDGRTIDVVMTTHLWWALTAEMDGGPRDGIPSVADHLMADHGFEPRAVLGRAHHDLAIVHASLHPGTRRRPWPGD